MRKKSRLRKTCRELSQRVEPASPSKVKNTENDSCHMGDKDSGWCSQQKNSVQEPYTMVWGRKADPSQGCLLALA